jgi:hypothetical protein
LFGSQTASYVIAIVVAFFFTPVAVSANVFKKIGDLKVGEPVLTLNKEKKWVSTQVTFSGGTEDATYVNPYMIYVKTEDNTVLISTADHLFLMPDGSLKRADRLKTTDFLINDQLKQVKIIELTSGHYTGKIHHIATGEWNEENVHTDGHLINTFGVISGDYFLQLHYKNSVNDSLPQLGTPANKPQAINALPTTFSVSKDGTIINMKSGNESEFLNTQSRKTTKTFKGEFLETTFSFTPNIPKPDPKDAVYFIPPGLDSSAVPLAPLDNTVPYEMAVHLENHFKTYYPNIEYRIAWTDQRVNAFATREGNKHVVTLLGGLIRHPYLQLEGIGLVLAHEIGHHLAGPPYYPGSWASCEGQSDYWGAKVAMRKVWWGAYAIEQLEKGSQQVYNLFAYGLKAGNIIALDFRKSTDQNRTAAGICTHPPAQCRLDTYRAAIFLYAKPTCAGDPR